MRWLQRDSGHPRREPVGVVGGRRASADELAKAHALGAALAKVGCAVLCGGRGGVMRAACEGVASAGGISIGLLPGDTIADANDAVTVPLATGLGYARNAVIARASMCLVSIGGSYGTISELALAMQGGKVGVRAEAARRPIDGVDVVGVGRRGDRRRSRASRSASAAARRRRRSRSRRAGRGAPEAAVESGAARV